MEIINENELTSSWGVKYLSLHLKVFSFPVPIVVRDGIGSGHPLSDRVILKSFSKKLEHLGIIAALVEELGIVDP